MIPKGHLTGDQRLYGTKKHGSLLNGNVPLQRLNIGAHDPIGMSHEPGKATLLANLENVGHAKKGGRERCMHHVRRYRSGLALLSTFGHEKTTS